MQYLVNVDLHPDNTIDLITNIDGFKPFKSSKVHIWPILIEIFHILGIYKPFTVAAYSGNSHPKDPYIFLKDFLTELNKLIREGITILSKKFKVRIKFITADTPARSYMKCCMGHTSKKACERCTAIGESIDYVMTFLDFDAPKRTDEDFRSFKDAEYHHNPCPFLHIEFPLDLIALFVLDPMHLWYLVILKRILDFWFLPGHKKCRQSNSMKMELDRRTKMTYKDIPSEFFRKMRSTINYGIYKAVESSFFLKYCGPVALKKILDKKYYNHFLLLHYACRLLSEPNAERNTDEARACLRKFLDDVKDLYGPTFCTVSVHNLIHVCDDIDNTKCNLMQLSAFKFESYLSKIGRKLLAPTNLLAQYCNRMYEEDVHKATVAILPLEIEIISENENEITSLKYRQYTLTAKHQNTLLLKNGKVVKINKIYKKNSKIFLRVQNYKKKDLVY